MPIFIKYDNDKNKVTRESSADHFIVFEFERN